MEQLDIEELSCRLREMDNQQSKRELVCLLKEEEKENILNLWKESLAFPDYSSYIKSLSLAVKYLLQQDHSKTVCLAKTDVEALSRFMEKNKQIDDLLSICCQLNRTELKTEFKESQCLFLSLMSTFEFIQDQRVRSEVTKLILEMMIENRELIKWGNQPYYPLQFYVYQINKTESSLEVLELFDYLRRLILIPHSQQLFTGADYRAVVDVLIRHIENCEDQHTMARLLETYLILSINPKMMSKGSYYKIEEVRTAIQDIGPKSTEVQQLAQQIETMIKQSKNE